jgi:GT2 family glycosyltransferase
MNFLRNRLRTIVGENASWVEAVSRIVYYTSNKVFSPQFYAELFNKSAQPFTTFSLDGFISKQEAIQLATTLQHNVTIAIVVAGDNMDLLTRTWESIKEQYYKPVCIGFTHQLMANTTQQLWVNSTEKQAQLKDAGYILTLDQGDILSKDALLQVVIKLSEERTDPKAIYFWEAHRDTQELGYKPCWNKGLIHNTNAVTHALVHQSLFSEELLFTEDHGLRQSLQAIDFTQTVCVRKVLLQTITEQRIWENTDLKSENADRPLVSIIIPTRNKYHLVKQTIDSVLEKSTYQNYEIILVDNGSDEQTLLEYIEQLKATEPQRFKCVSFDHEFNFSALINFGVQNCSGSYLVLLNNDVKIITPDWIERMLQQASLQGVGAVGAKLLYPNETIQHAGIVLNKKNISKHLFVGAKRTEEVEQNAINTNQNYLAVTAACLMVSRKKFDEVGGFDPKFKVEFNDIDFCLKLYAHNLNNVYLHEVELFHYESASRRHPHSDSRSYKQHMEETELMREKWRLMIENDPFNIYSN